MNLYGEAHNEDSVPQVSVLMPVFNHRTYVGQALTSVIGQTFTNWELVVVDDGSDDGSADCVAAIGDPRVQLIRTPHRGRAAARNRAVQEAAGLYVAFLDADDAFGPEKLARQVRVLDAEPDAAVVFSQISLISAAGEVLSCSPIPGIAKVERIFDKNGLDRFSAARMLARLSRGNVFPIHAALIRRSCLPLPSPFTPGLEAFEDWDLWLRLAEKNDFIFLPGTVGDYRLHSAMTTRELTAMWRGALTVRKNLRNRECFTTLSRTARRHSHTQEGLLSCLDGSPADGRRLLLRAAFSPPFSPRAFGAWALSFLGTKALRRLVGCRIRRHEWSRHIPWDKTENTRRNPGAEAGNTPATPDRKIGDTPKNPGENHANRPY